MKNKRPSPEWTEARVKEYQRYGYVEDGLAYDQNYLNVHVRDREYTGSTTPNFKKVKRLPFNNFHVSLSNMSATYLVQKDSFTYSQSVHPSIAGKTYLKDYQYYWATGQSFGSASGHIASAEAKCSQRLQAQFSAIKVNLAQFFGERHQFISMVGTNARRIVHAARSLRKLRLGDAMNALALGNPSVLQEQRFWERHNRNAGKFPKKLRPEKVFSSAWLELQYGWKPLLQDVYATAELLADKIRKDEFSNVVKSSATTKESNVWNFYNYRGLPPFGNQPIGNVSRQTTCKYVAKFRSTNELKSAFAVTGISNPAVLAWELTPFSFVVDWFLPVGNFLEQLTAYNGFEFDSIHRVLFSRGVIDVSGSFGDPAYTVWQGSYSGSRCTVTGSYLAITYDRDSIPTPAFVPLEFKSPVSVIHAANAIALLAQVFGRK